MKKKIKLSKSRDWDSGFMTIPNWDLEKIKTAKVMVVGAGALGNEVIKNLTLLNVGNLVIVDFDLVEYGNLAKSVLFREEDTGAKKVEAIAKNLKTVNKNVKTLTISGDVSTDVGLGVFRRVDVVIGCLDNRLARMFINRHCYKVNKTWVDGALENLAGRFRVFKPGVSCFECSLTDDAREVINFRMGCPDIAKRNASVGVIATTPVSASIIGAFQVQEALKIIFGTLDYSMAGEGFQYDGMNNFFLKYIESPLRPDCNSHVFYEAIIEAKELSYKTTVGEILKWAAEKFSAGNPRILLDEDIVLEVATSRRGITCQTAIYKNHLFEAAEIKELNIEPDEELYIKKDTWFIDKGFPFPERTLQQIGIPFLDILKIETEHDVYFVELTGDENLFHFK